MTRARYWLETPGARVVTYPPAWLAMYIFAPTAIIPIGSWKPAPVEAQPTKSPALLMSQAFTYPKLSPE